MDVDENVLLKSTTLFEDLIYTRNLPHVCKREECTGGYTQKCWVMDWPRNNGEQGGLTFCDFVEFGLAWQARAQSGGIVFLMRLELITYIVLTNNCY